MGKVSFIIPTLNEVEGIIQVLESIPEEELMSRGYEVETMVVDGGSSDGTRDAAKEFGVDVYYEKGGKTSAVRRGLNECQGDFVFLIDGDGSYPCNKILEMQERLENGNSMVLGNRFSGDVAEGAMSRTNRIGNKVLTSMANRLYGTDVSDLCTGLRGIIVDHLEGSISGKGFEIEAELHALMCDKNICEIPISYNKRIGESKLRVWDGLKIAKRLFLDKFKK